MGLTTDFTMNDMLYGNNFSTFEKQDKVLVALSGGVDSGVCVKILQEKGFDVTALVIRFSPAHDGAVTAAKNVADALGVLLHIADAVDIFNQKVVEPFCESYCNGITPSPCVMCNPLVKFRTLAAMADSLGIRFIASGHYARVEENDGLFYISKAESPERDQSYMLYRLPQDILQRLLLPVGEFAKPDIRDMAREASLPCADAPDSQEICFIPDGDYAKYIAQHGYEAKQGKFIGPLGEDLGAHKGVLHYTIGQRKGLGISYSEPLFVKKIFEDGNIQLSKGGEEFYSKIVLKNIVFVRSLTPTDVVTAKIRSRSDCVACDVKINGDSACLTFKSPVRAPAPGQSAVLYIGNCVVGGGIISEIE